MKQYIDKDALVAKIKERYECWREKEFNSHSLESKIRMSECQHLMLLLNTLEVKEADLEKEVNTYMDNEMKFLSDEVGYDTLLSIAHYFFELGFKAQKGEKV